MNKIVSWVVTLIIALLIILLTYQTFLYSIIYKSLIKDRELTSLYKETKYKNIEGKYISIFDDLEISEELYNKYNLSDCLVDIDNGLFCAKSNLSVRKYINKAEVIFVGDSFQHGLSLNLHNNNDAIKYLNKLAPSSFIDGIIKLGKSNFDKVSFFTNPSKLKEIILKTNIKLNVTSDFGFDYYTGESTIIKKASTDLFIKGKRNVDFRRYQVVISGKDHFYKISTNNYDLFDSLVERVRLKTN